MGPLPLNEETRTSTRRKPAMLGGAKLDNTLLTCDQGNFNVKTARSRIEP